MGKATRKCLKYAISKKEAQKLYDMLFSVDPEIRKLGYSLFITLPDVRYNQFLIERRFCTTIEYMKYCTEFQMSHVLTFLSK